MFVVSSLSWRLSYVFPGCIRKNNKSALFPSPYHATIYYDVDVFDVFEFNYETRVKNMWSLYSLKWIDVAKKF